MSKEEAWAEWQAKRAVNRYTDFMAGWSACAHLLEKALAERDAWGRTHQEDVKKIEELERRLHETHKSADGDR